MPERFSSGYVLISDADVVSWSDEVAAMDYELYDYLAHHYGEPVVGYVGGLHFVFQRHREGIPSLTAAVPEDSYGQTSEPSGLLVQK